MMYYCRFITCTKYTKLLGDDDNREGYMSIGEEIYAGSLYFFNFAVNLKQLCVCVCVCVCAGVCVYKATFCQNELYEKGCYELLSSVKIWEVKFSLIAGNHKIENSRTSKFKCSNNH